MTTTNRYIRQQQLPGFGVEAQQKLAQAKVLVVGAGGLGVPALQYLCGMGIGTVGVVDGDTVSITNLHRQVLYAEADIGKKKAIVAGEKLRQLNSSITIQVYDEMLTAANAIALIEQYHLVIDATDNFAARYLINDACVITGKPFVYAAIQSWEAHLSVFNYNGGPTYRCLYPQQPSTSEIPDCNTAGVLGVVPGIMGCRQALEAVKIITGVGKPLTGYLKIVDFENDTEYKIKLVANPANTQIKTLREDVDNKCSTSINNLSPLELLDWFKNSKEFLLVDVREPSEFNSGHLKGAQNSPLALLHDKRFDSKIPIVLYCKTGKRSKLAAMQLYENNTMLQLYDTVGGIDYWVEILNNHLIER